MGKSLKKRTQVTATRMCCSRGRDEGKERGTTKKEKRIKMV